MIAVETAIVRQSIFIIFDSIFQSIQPSFAILASLKSSSPMIALEQWLKASTNPCIQKWSSELINLGASWETFGRKENDVVDNLVNLGIPKLAACDIYSIVHDSIKRTQAPLVVYWDLEDHPIPVENGATEIALRIKRILEPHGTMVQFRAYGNLSFIPEWKRSELQLSGCHLVDVPDNGRKELIGKFIIIDAMEFAFKSEQATICFITSDADFAYLLNRLQAPQWQTIVISKGNVKALQSNCDLAIQWESEILDTFIAPPGFQSLSVICQESSLSDRIATQLLTSATVAKTPPVNEQRRMYHDKKALKQIQESTTRPSLDDEDRVMRMTHQIPPLIKQGNVHSTNALSRSQEHCESESLSDEDLKMLRAIVVNYAHIGFDGPGTIKSQVWGMLRQTYPSRFCDRFAVQTFLAKAIATGAVIEEPYGDSKLLYLQEDHNIGHRNLMNISKHMPLSWDEIPFRVQEVSKSLPMVIFFPKHHVPLDDILPKKTFIQSSGKWMILMYQSLCEIQKAVTSKPWLKAGILIDLRILAATVSPIASVEMALCTKCEERSSVTELFIESAGDCAYCRSCYLSEGCWTTSKKASVACKVTTILEMMSENDDVYVRSSLLKKMIVQRWPGLCYSRAQATLWIVAAEEQGSACELKIKGQGSKKSKVFCLTRNMKWALETHPDAGMESGAEERYVVDLLWTMNDCIPRREVLHKLKQVFPTMDTPLKRNKMFLNAMVNDCFCIGKGPYGQIVGLSRADVEIGLDMLLGIMVRA